jgi:hypothetical protein
MIMNFVFIFVFTFNNNNNKTVTSIITVFHILRVLIGAWLYNIKKRKSTLLFFWSLYPDLVYSDFFMSS